MTQAKAIQYTEIAKWAGRKSITRINPIDKKSAYVSIALLVDNDQRIGYLDLSVEHEGEIRFGFAPLPLLAAPMFTVSTLDYREETLGSRALHDARHWTEAVDTIHVAVDSLAAHTPTALNVGEKPVDGIAVMGQWRSKREKGETVYYDTEVALNGVTPAIIEAALNKEAARINRNEPPVDTRVKEWNKNPDDVTAFGQYKAQQSATRKIRAGK